MSLVGKSVVLPERFDMKWLLGIVGGIIGAVLGYFLFDLLLSQGFYAIAIPGAAIGLGCGQMSRMHSIPLGILAAIAALLFGCYLEWKFFPFVDDDSLGFFVQNLHELNMVTWLMILVGAVGAFSLGKGQKYGSTAPETKPISAD